MAERACIKMDAVTTRFFSLSLSRFLRELAQLKSNSNSGDKELYDWLKTLGPEYPQYAHNLMHCGIDMQLLPFVTDNHLKDDAGITNGVHRMKVLKAIHPWGRDTLPHCCVLCAECSQFSMLALCIYLNSIVCIPLSESLDFEIALKL